MPLYINIFLFNFYLFILGTSLICKQLITIHYYFLHMGMNHLS